MKLPGLKCLAVVVLALCVSCTRVAPAEPETLYGFELAGFEGVAPTDVAFRIEPAVAKQDLAQPSSQLMANALRSCLAMAGVPGALDTPRSLEFTLRKSRLARGNAPPQHSPLSDCLLASLDGKTFNVAGATEHTVTIQLRRHFKLP